MAVDFEDSRGRMPGASLAKTEIVDRAMLIQLISIVTLAMKKASAKPTPVTMNPMAFITMKIHHAQACLRRTRASSTIPITPDAMRDCLTEPSSLSPTKPLTT